MTTVVFNSGILTIATPSWAATTYNEKNREQNQVQVHCLDAPIDAKCTLAMTMTEWLALVAEAGAVLDLRQLQEPQEPSVREQIEEILRKPGGRPLL